MNGYHALSIRQPDARNANLVIGIRNAKMPEMGEIRSSRAGRVIWQACIVCGKERWVQLRRNIPASIRCGSCAARINGRWKGGRRTNSQGYVYVQLKSDNQFYGMANKRGYTLEHRLVIARKIGRPLSCGEHVHHKDGIRSNNSEDNLELISRANHMLYDRLCSRCPLRKEIRLLRWQVKELMKQIQGQLIADKMMVQVR